MSPTGCVARIACLSVTLFGITGAVVACEEDASSIAFEQTVDSGGVSIPSTPASPSADAGSDSDVSPDANADGGGDADASQILAADLTKDFSKTTNPHGAWTYGYATGVPGADAGSFVVFSAPSDTMGVTLWLDPTNQVLNAPTVYLNESGATVNGVQPGEVALHPGNAGEYAVARWTAPIAGTYAVRVQFKEGDTGDTNGLLLHNGAVLVNEDSTATNAVHTLTVAVAAGDTLEVAVGSKGSFLNDSTPVVFEIRTSTP